MKKIVTILFVIAALLTANVAGFAVQAEDQSIAEENQVNMNEDQPDAYEDQVNKEVDQTEPEKDPNDLEEDPPKTEEKEEKIICQATLEDDFADDSVLVVINKANSEINKVYTTDMFPGVELKEIKDLTYIEGNPDEKSYLNQEKFHQILHLKLIKPGKEEVLKAIREIEKLDFVLAAEPNYYVSVDPILPPDSPKTGQNSSLWFVLFLLSGGTIILLTVGRIQKKFI